MVDQGENDSTSPPEGGEGRKRLGVVRLLRFLNRRGRKTKREKEEEHAQNERIVAHWTRHLGLLTAVLALCAVLNVVVIALQLREMHSGGVDTHELALATGNLVVAGRDQARSMNALRAAGEDQANAMNRLESAGEDQANATKNLATNSSKQLQLLAAQQNIANGQLSELREERRPWIVANVTLDAPVEFSRWNSSFTQIQANLKFSFKNLGRSPAENVRISGEIIKHPGNPNYALIATSQEKHCKAARADADAHRIGDVGVGPGENKDVSLGFVNTAPPDGALYSIHGCIDYTYDINYHGQTEFRMLLGKIEGGAWQKLSTPTSFTPWPDYVPIPGMPINGPVGTSIPVAAVNFGEDPGGGNYGR